MYATKEHGQDGALLIGFAIILLFLTSMGISILSLLLADTKILDLYHEESKAFYAAESGLEYALKTILQSNTPKNWQESHLNTGMNTTCDLRVQFIGKDTIRVLSTGKSSLSQKSLEVLLFNVDSMDVSGFAVYCRGTVKNIRAGTISPVPVSRKLIYENAAVMPQFDLDRLRKIAKYNRTYRTGSLRVTARMYFRPKSLIFVEGNAYFFSLHPMARHVFFVVTGNVYIFPWFRARKSSPIVLYLPDKHSRLFVRGAPGSALYGGIISEADIHGLFRGIHAFTIYRDPQALQQFLKYSVNGGSRVIQKSSWKVLN